MRQALLTGQRSTKSPLLTAVRHPGITAAMNTPTFRLGSLALGVALLCPSVRGQYASPHEKRLGQPAPPTTAARLMENLDRGLVAVNKGAGKVFISWRLLGTEAPDTGFILYRTTGAGAPVKLNAAPLTQGTCFEDSGVDLSGGRR